MNAITQTIIDKIKRNITTTDTDAVIAAKIGDSFDDIKNDTGFYFSFIDETDFEITPTIADADNAYFRLAMFYKTASNYMVKKQDDAAGKAVRVKSGRDEVDTTKTAGAYKDTIDKKMTEYWKCVNKINLKYGGKEITVPETEVEV
jgi:hypothetical protein